VIGCVAISRSHLDPLSRHDEVQLVACADVCEVAATHCARQFSIPHAYPDAREVLARSDVDAVVICVPPRWHAKLVLEALAEGKHVLVEKPLAMDLEEADRIVDAALSSDGIVGVALVHRYLPSYRILRELVQAGAIGHVRHLRYTFGKDMYDDSRFTRPKADPRAWLVDRSVAGGGLLMSSSVHHLSAVSFVVGEPAALRVTARVRELHPGCFPGIEDDVDLWIELDNDVEFVLHESWAADEPCSVRLAGDRGSLTATGSSWDGLAVSGRCEGDVPPQYRKWFHGSRLVAPIDPGQSDASGMFGGLIQSFIGSIQHGAVEPPLPSVRHARNIQAIVAAAYQSGASGEPRHISWRDELSQAVGHED
jgi:UDP-N-acetyl-2-amino-2-deoxyglucuronate dehydrogenase